MKKMLLAGIAVMLMSGAGALAQTTTLASSMDVYVFPSDGQESSQQSKKAGLNRGSTGSGSWLPKTYPLLGMLLPAGQE